jgi:hypothetical protein
MDTPKPGDFPIGSVESRAAMRLRLNQGDESQVIEIVSLIPRPGRDNTRPRVTREKGNCFRILYVPPGMAEDEAREITGER